MWTWVGKFPPHHLPPSLEQNIRGKVAWVSNEPITLWSKVLRASLTPNEQPTHKVFNKTFSKAFRVEQTFDSMTSPDLAPHLFIMLVHPRKNNSFTDAIDVAAQRVSINIRQREAGVWTWRVLELPRRYPRQHQCLRGITSHVTWTIINGEILTRQVTNTSSVYFLAFQCCSKWGQVPQSSWYV